VNSVTLNLLERPYQEIVDDILTSIVGGVVNEASVFDEKSLFYPLSQPATAVRSIRGDIAGTDPTQPVHHAFLQQVDYTFVQGQNGIGWLPTGVRPLDGSIFYVDYFRQNSQSPLTDINIGSVNRTLSEAIGREIATVYQEINLAYLSAFIDTATGKSLDLVVSILNVVRKTKDFSVGNVTFFRTQGTEGNISLPQGLALSTPKGITFQTIEPRTLLRGESRADVPVRADIAGDKGIVAAGSITEISQSIEGISRITNFDPTTRAANDESDTDLRLRAKAALRGLGKATIAALAQVVFDDRSKLDEIYDPNNLNGKASPPGTVALLVETDPGRFPALQAAVDQTRAAGVQATVLARFVYFKLRMNVKVTPGLTGAGKEKIQNDIIAALQTYTDTLASAQSAVGSTMLATVKKVKDVKDAKFLQAFAWRTDVGHPGTDPLVEAIVAALQGVNNQDTAAVRVAVQNVLSSTIPALLPSGEPIPDNSLIRGPSGQKATDGQIEAANFKVVPPGSFSVIAYMEPADIVLQDS
jgi:uncharacterized phage protein gp47/JayE